MNNQVLGESNPAAFMELLHQRLTQLREKLATPSLSKEAILVLTTELQPIYKKLLMADLDAGVQRQIENFMWNDCFKKPLTYFMRVDKSLFHFMIESGVGFYLGFIQDVGMQFDVSFIKNSSQTLFAAVPKMKAILKCSPSKAAVYYIIQNSLVHVGDLLRYRGSFVEALKMYDKSTSVCPMNGHPYNQMGLVQISMDSKSVDSLLTGVYCYARAMSVSNPFIASQQNLEGLLAKAKATAPSSGEDPIILCFLQTISSIVMNTTTPLPPFTFEPLSQPIERLTFAQLFRMMIITLWAWKRESDKNMLGLDGHNEGKALELVAVVINGIMSTGLNEIKDITKFLTLAHLNIMMEWMRLNPAVLTNPSFRSNLNTSSLCRVANQILPYESNYLGIATELHYVILPEEKKLLGFLPTSKAYEHLQSVMEETDPRAVALRVIRFIRMADFFSDARFSLIQRTGNEFKEVPYTQIQILRPPPRPRRNVALQSIFNKMGQDAAAGGMPLSFDTNEDAENKPKPPAQKKGLFSTTLAKALEHEKVAPPASSSSAISAETSPTPLSGGCPPHPIDTQFSLLFNSIWTPLGEMSGSGEGDGNGDGEDKSGVANIWKF